MWIHETADESIVSKNQTKINEVHRFHDISKTKHDLITKHSIRNINGSFWKLQAF